MHHMLPHDSSMIFITVTNIAAFSAMKNNKHISQYLRNCQLAFQTAEDRLGITSLLDVCDVARGPRDVSRAPSRRVSPGSPPDRLSILTYVAQFYHKFHHLTDPRQEPGLGAPDTAAAEDGHR